MTTKIEMVNENEKPVKVRIKPEGSVVGRILWKTAGETITGAIDEIIGSQNQENYLEDNVLEIPAKGRITYSLDLSNIKGINSFSIKGDTSMFTPGSECEKLNVLQNYRITFTDDLIGTTCKAVKI
ncbi:MAG: hypothetical protein V4544_04510 [Pseudomonadota bacterium]